MSLSRKLCGTALATAVAGGLIAAPSAFAQPSPEATAAAISTGSPIRAMVRNGTTTKQTQIIGNFAASNATGTYVTRQSNTATGANAGGGAIYGCRGAAGGTASGSAPCVRAANLANGYAFEFAFNGASGGVFTVGNPATANPNAAPFTTNATGVATGLNANYLQGQTAAEVAANPGPPNGNAGGALAGTYPNPTIATGTRGVALAGGVFTSTGGIDSYFNRGGAAPTVTHTANSGVYVISFPGGTFGFNNSTPVVTLLGGFGFVQANVTGNGSIQVSTAGLPTSGTTPAPQDIGFSLSVFGSSAQG